MSSTEKSHSSPLRWLLDLLMVLTVLPLLAMVIFCVILSHKIFHPPRKTGLRPPNTSLQLESVQLSTLDGLMLAAWLVQHPAPKGCVVICHEWGSHKATKLKYAEFLYEAGYESVLFDLRNHGDSNIDKAWGDMSRRYTDDLETVITYVSAHPSLRLRPIAVLSFSFSTFPAMHCLAHRQPAKLTALVFDSGPTLSERELAKNFLNSVGRIYFPAWLRGPILFPLAANLAERFVSYFLHVDWPPPITPLNRPMLFICGGGDDIAPLAAIQPLASQVPLGELWVVPESPHLLSFKVAPLDYRKRVIDFLNRACLAGIATSKREA